MKQGLFNASFERSKRLVNRKVMTEEGAGIGELNQLNFFKKFTMLFPVSFGLALVGAVGYGIPTIGQAEPEEINVITYETALYIGKIGEATRPLFIFFFVGLVLLVLLNLLPKKNYAYQLVYGNFTVFILCLTTALAVAPMVIGATLGGSGWLGFFFQLALILYLFVTSLINRRKELLYLLYKTGEKRSDVSGKLGALLPVIGAVGLGLMLIDKLFLRIGDLDVGGSNLAETLLGLFYGWALLIVGVVFVFMFSATCKTMLSVYYFVKYNKEYYTFFEVTDEEWYGKRKAKKLAKKRAKQDRV